MEDDCASNISRLVYFICKFYIDNFEVKGKKAPVNSPRLRAEAAKNRLMDECWSDTGYFPLE
jgi:hypothetical protein